MTSRFSLTRGGPFYAIARRCHLVDPRGRLRIVHLSLLAWVPLLAGWTTRVVSGRDSQALLAEPSVHVRFLITLPLLLLAEHVLELACRKSAELMRDKHEHQAELDRIFARAERMRDRASVEIALLVIPLLAGQAALWGLLPSGVVHAQLAEGSRSFAVIWYVVVGVPFVQFLMLRWLWRWLIWLAALVHIARYPLPANALHPDGAAGLRYLTLPVNAFALFVGAGTALLSSAWMPRLLAEETSLARLAPGILVLLGACIAVGCGPLLAFVPRMYRARLYDVAAYDAVAHAFVTAFRAKWLAANHAVRDTPILAAPDFSALADLDGSFQSADETRVWIADRRTLAVITLGVVGPMVPLVLAEVPIAEFTTHVIEIFLGEL